MAQIGGKNTHNIRTKRQLEYVKLGFTVYILMSSVLRSIDYISIYRI